MLRVVQELRIQGARTLRGPVPKYEKCIKTPYLRFLGNQKIYFGSLLPCFQTCSMGAQKTTETQGPDSLAPSPKIGGYTILYATIYSILYSTLLCSTLDPRPKIRGMPDIMFSGSLWFCGLLGPSSGTPRHAQASRAATGPKLDGRGAIRHPQRSSIV